jgi:hypothetical protein
LGVTSTTRANPNITFPYFRYVDFNAMDMTSQETAKNTLKYKDKTWNLPFTAKIEMLDLTSIELESPEQELAVYDLGFEDWIQWDCYINHFENYDWIELVDPELPDGGFQRFLIQLGYNEASYNEEGAAPESEDLYWKELSDDQQEAATNLCYFEEIWNEELSIPEWSNHYTASPTTSNMPSDAPSLMPSDVPSLMPSDMPSAVPTPIE